MSHESNHPTTAQGALEVTSFAYHGMEEAMRGTRTNGPGEAAVNGLAYAVQRLQAATHLINACGEQAYV